MANKNVALPTQQFVPIDEIKDNVVVLRGGAMRAVLMCSSVNFDLKSQDEQTAIIMQFQNFLNGLDFPIQISIQSRRLEINEYIEGLNTTLENQKSELLKVQTQEYIEFIKSFVETQNIMAKTFYVIIPYAQDIMSSSGGFLSKLLGGGARTNAAKEKEENFDKKKQQLAQRTANIAAGLQTFGVKSIQLGNQDLAELFYKLYNPGEKGKKQLQI